MITKIASYGSHEKALDAIKDLKKAGFPLKQVSLIGEAQIVDDHMCVSSVEPIKNLPIAVGALAGIVTGLLTGIGIFGIPGFGFLYGAGAIVGAIGGLDLGIIGGGLVTILTHIGIKNDEVIKYEEHIREGKFLLVAKGTQQEIERAETILHIENKSPQLHRR